MHRRNFLVAAGSAAVTRADAAVPATPRAFGAVADGATDSTEALQAMLDAGGDIRWTAGRYLTRRLQLRSRTRIVFDPGVVISGIPGQPGVLLAADAEDLSLEGQGATILGPPGTRSHTVNLSGARRATLRGLDIKGGDGGGKDALYIGSGRGPSRDIHVDGCVLRDARRNCLSVVSCFGFLIENCDVYGADDAPGAGIDVEANRHGEIGGGVIRRNRVHDNGRFGIVVAFGDDVRIHENEVFANGNAGIAVASGGAQFVEGVFRPGVDIVPVAGFNPRTGEVEVPDASRIEVGTLVSWRKRKGTEPPPEFAKSDYFVVVGRDVARRTLQLSADGVQPVGRVSPGRARLGRTLQATDLALRVFVEGQASNVDIYRNRCRHNGKRAEIEVLPSVGVRVRDNEIDAGPDRAGVFATYARRLSITGNRMVGSTASKNPLSRGLHVGLCSHVEHGGNVIQDFGYAGVWVDGVAGSYRNTGDRIVNCGWLPGGAPSRVERVAG